MSLPSDDAWLDDQLREMPLPEGFLARLHGCLQISDEELDRRITAVPVPAGVVARLYDVPADVELEAEVNAVETPDELLVRLREISRIERRPKSGLSAARRFAETSLLTAAAAAAFIAFTAGWVADSLRPEASGRGHEIVVLDAPWSITAVTSEVEAQFLAARVPEAVELPTAGRGNWMNDNETVPVSLVDDALPPELGPVGRMLAAHATEDYGANVVVLRWGVLASGQRMEDDLPVIERSESLATSGMQPPLIRGYNRAFWLKHRVQPPLRTGVPELQSVAPPVVTSGRSFERAEKAVASGHLPPAGEIRPEEFLAATVRYPPAKPGEIAIHAAGGPSRYGPSGTRLLQVGLQAGMPRKRVQAATSLIVILDVSASMGRSGRLAAACEAIAALPRCMSPDDRLTIAAFTDGEVLTLEDIPAAGVDGMLPQLEKVHPVGSFDLPAALEFAATLALARSGESQARRIAVVTDDDSQLPDELAWQLKSLLEALGKEGIAVDLIDTIATAQPQAQFMSLADWSGGRTQSASNAAQIAWSLTESLFGQNPVIASEVALRLEFDPRSIAAYRLIGHEGNALSSVVSANTPADLRAGEAATTLFELWPAMPEAAATPGSYREKPDSTLATVTLRWKDAATSEFRSATRRVTASDFRATFADGTPAWQTAAIAAESAELLRNSREALREIGVVSPKRTTVEDLCLDMRRVPQTPEMSDQRVRLNRFLEELKRAKSR
jgi:Ca-activated chloride channel family protein